MVTSFESAGHRVSTMISTAVPIKEIAKDPRHPSRLLKKNSTGSGFDRGGPATRRRHGDVDLV